MDGPIESAGKDTAPPHPIFPTRIESCAASACAHTHTHTQTKAKDEWTRRRRRSRRKSVGGGYKSWFPGVASRHSILLYVCPAACCLLPAPVQSGRPSVSASVHLSRAPPKALDRQTDRRTDTATTDRPPRWPSTRQCARSPLLLLIDGLACPDSDTSLLSVRKAISTARL